MRFPEYALRNKNFINFATILIVIGGVWAYFKLGKLEDPEFTIKTAMIVTAYPGATPNEVEEQVTEPLERAVQQLSYLDHVRSISKSGISYIYVDVKEHFRSHQMNQIWDELRRKVYDARAELPPGALEPIVVDDYGDVYGVFIALYGKGFTMAEMEDYAEILQRELLLVKDVSRVQIYGEARESVSIRFSRSKMAEMDIHPDSIFQMLSQQNKVVDPGAVEIGSERIQLRPTGVFKTVDEIGNLVIKGATKDDMIQLKDIAEIKREYLAPPTNIMRFNGEPAIGIAVSTVSGGNVVEMGDAVKKRVGALMARMPVGLKTDFVSLQSDTVKEAVDGFILNLLESVSIVILILLITMGMRSGLIIGSGLLFTILATLIMMYLLQIDLQRTSLASLIIAMGMLVDNAIVVTEGALIRLQRGSSRFKAAVLPAEETAWPLLGATIVAILAFIPIYITGDNTGEYCETLFQVVAISLGISWIIAMTSTPILCEMFLKIKPDQLGRDPYAGKPYQIYKAILEWTLRNRCITLLVMLALLMTSIWGFGFVDQIFFPESNRKQFMIDYWLPEGSRIEKVAGDIKQIEGVLAEMPDVASYATCIGAGPPRFYLPYNPELANSSYGQIIVNVKKREAINYLLPKLEHYVKTHFPQAEPRVRRFPLGPSNAFKIELRFSGPDIEVLKKLAAQAKSIMRKAANTKEVRDDWRQQVKTLVPVVSQPRSRRVMATRNDIALSLRRLTDGVTVGYYRERDELLPIQVKAPEAERQDIENLKNVPIWGLWRHSVPLLQLVKEFKIEWENPIIRRRDRRRTVTVQCSPDQKMESIVRQKMAKQLEAIPLPPGYFMEWGGDYEDSTESQQAVFAKLPIALLLMALVVVWLFNAFKQPIIIAMILPLSLIGVTVGLLVMGLPFGFMALLGALSLFGMLIKNAVVLLDQIDIEIRDGKPPFEAVIDSAVSRMRPVMMASFTTVLGMLPLIWDTLFKSMAVAIMFGLTFATVLTLLVVPVLYTLIFKIKIPE